MKLSDIEAQAKVLAPILKGFIDKSVIAVRDEMTSTTDEKLKALSDKMEASVLSLIAMMSDLPAAVDGKDGKDGESIAIEDVQAMIDKSLGEIEIVAPEDGRDALDLDILPCIDLEKSYPRGTYAMHDGGLWRSHGATSDMRGWDCIVNGVQHHSTSQIDERTFKSTTLLSDGKLISNEFTMPVLLYKNVFKEGQQYRKGDMVTSGGSLWHCDEDTTDKPGSGSRDWTLCAKKGADGRKV